MRLTSVLCLLVLCGCGDGAGGPEMADVSGTVTLEGKPLSGAEIHFVSGAFEGYGRTNDEGHYSLVLGAPVGECKVYITKVSEGGASDGVDTNIEGMDDEQMKAMTVGQQDPKAKPLLPPEFSDAENTKLTFNVPAAGTDKADFKL